MYRRPKFLEVLISIRQEMAREADYDTDLFAERVRSGPRAKRTHSLSAEDAQNGSEPKVRRPGRRKAA